MGFDAVSWLDVQTFLAEFFGSGLISQGLAAVIAMGLAAFGLKAAINAFHR